MLFYEISVVVVFWMIFVFMGSVEISVPIGVRFGSQTWVGPNRVSSRGLRKACHMSWQMVLYVPTYIQYVHTYITSIAPVRRQSWFAPGYSC